ncbi:MAG: cellulase family glycosylhydrolase [Nitrososphaeraceae archaeon]
MKRSGTITTRRWFWPIQITVGIICISLSIWIVFSPQIGNYALFFLAGTGLIILGAERIISGIKAEKSRRKYRIINVVIGAAIIAYILPGFIVPALVIKYLVLFLGFGLLANGALRIIDGLRTRKQEQSLTFSSLGTGIIITAVAIAVLVFPKIGLVILIVMTAVALAVSGVQVIIAGIRGSRSRSDSMPLSKIAVEGDKEYQQQQQLNRNGKSIWKNGSWFNDDQGRYLLFRGVNFASRTKLAPYLPIAPLETKTLSQLNLKQEIKSVEPELDRLRDLGFNIVRLLISWKAIEPRPNTNLEELLPEGKQYLTCVKEIIEELHARKLYVILDFHQDIAHEVYGGDGFPDWALAIDTEHKVPEPSNLRDKKWMIKYVINKSLKNTLASFWQNDLTNIEGENKLEHFPVRTHLEKTIGQTARFFRLLNNGAGHPAILGIEPFNEPHPAGLSKEQFEGKFLVDYYRNVDLEIRKVDPDVFIFMEPSVTWTIPSSSKGHDADKTMLGLFSSGPFSAKDAFNVELVKNMMVDGKINSKQLNTSLPKNLNSVSTFARNGVLSLHYYDMMAIATSFMKIPENMYEYKRAWPLIFAQLANAATERGLIPFLTEFGGSQEAEQVREFLNLQFEQIETHLLNATYWNYDLYNTEKGKDNWNLENFSLLGPNRIPRNLDVVARPYPMRSSAEPVLLFFDIESKYATIILKGKVVEAPTVIYVPFNLHYAPEFTVWATTSKQMEWDKDNQLLYWYPAKELALNQIIIGRNRNLDTSVLPKQAKELASEVTLVGSFS